MERWTYSLCIRADLRGLNCYWVLWGLDYICEIFCIMVAILCHILRRRRATNIIRLSVKVKVQIAWKGP